MEYVYIVDAVYMTLWFALIQYTNLLVFHEISVINEYYSSVAVVLCNQTDIAYVCCAHREDEVE